MTDIITDAKLVAGVTKYVPTIKLNSDGFFRDETGTVYALTKFSSSDDVNRCGVGAFSLSESSPFTAYCAIHDFEYSSPEYQSSNSEQRADEDLGRGLDKTAQGNVVLQVEASIMKKLVQWFAPHWWDNEETRR